MRNYIVIAKNIYHRIFLDENEKEFIKYNRKKWENWKVKQPKGKIIVNSYAEPGSILMYSFFCNILAKEKQAELVSYSMSAKIRNYAMEQMYSSFNVGHDEKLPVYPQFESDKVDEIYKEVFPQIKTKENLLDLCINNIWIGIDVYETYLRTGKTTVDLKDVLLEKTLRTGITMLLFWQKYFQKNKILAVVVSHDCYLQFNVLAKVAYARKIPVYIPTLLGCSKSEYPYQMYKQFGEYRNVFHTFTLEKQNSAKEWAKKQLEKRFNGDVGVDMFYSTASAFQEIDNQINYLEKNNKIKVLICSHCFFDNPHAIGKMFFSDFYEWLCFLGEISKKTDYDWYIKVHPDPLPGTIEKIKEIIKRYPKVQLLPYTVSHLQLAKEGIDFVLTCYGTVGEEYPLLGIPVINSGYNPRIAYDFNIHAHSKKEYESILLDLQNCKINISKQDVYEFYYMHHKYYGLVDNMLLDSYQKAMKTLDFSLGGLLPTSIYKYFLQKTNKRRMDKIEIDLSEFIRSDEVYYKDGSK